MFRRLFGGPVGTDVMRLDILMDYDLRSGSGCAALQWLDPHGGGASIRAILVALLYGRILCCHKETRTELFRRVDELAIENVRSSGGAGFAFGSWTLRLGAIGGDHTLWPWTMLPATHLSAPKTYTATLKQGQPNTKAPLGRSLHLDMRFGLERVLAPSSALIAISGFSDACDEETRYFLALLLWQMNVYWRSPEGVSTGSEAVAYAAADSAIRSEQLKAP